MEEFLRSLDTQVGAYRKASTATLRAWVNVEKDFKAIQRRTGPLLKTWDMPQRDESGRREDRVRTRREADSKQTSPRRARVEPPQRERPQTAMQVTHFKREKYGAFSPQTQRFRVGRAYPSALDRRRESESR